jgi:hypothetical protein
MRMLSVPQVELELQLQTGLKNLNGFTSNPGGVYFTQNDFLVQVTIEISGTTSIGPNTLSFDGTGVVLLSSNSGSVNVSLPNLSNIDGYMQLEKCSALSVPALYRINGSFTTQNATFNSLQAPNLGIINGTLNITGSFTG